MTSGRMESDMDAIVSAKISFHTQERMQKSTLVLKQWIKFPHPSWPPCVTYQPASRRHSPRINATTATQPYTTTLWVKKPCGFCGVNQTWPLIFTRMHSYKSTVTITPPSYTSYCTVHLICPPGPPAIIFLLKFQIALTSLLSPSWSI